MRRRAYSSWAVIRAVRLFDFSCCQSNSSKGKGKEGFRKGRFFCTSDRLFESVLDKAPCYENENKDREELK